MPNRRSSGKGKVSRIYADEDFEFAILNKLRRLGHDVRHVRQDCLDKRGEGFADEIVFAEARRSRRLPLTHNADHFETIHLANPGHYGIVACAVESDYDRLAKAIDQFLRVNDVRSKYVCIRGSASGHRWKAR